MAKNSLCHIYVWLMSKDYPKESLSVSLCESVEVKIKCSLKNELLTKIGETHLSGKMCS